MIVIYVHLFNSYVTLNSGVIITRALVIRSLAHSTIPTRCLIVFAASFQRTYRLSLLQVSNCYYFCQLAWFSWSYNPLISWYQVTSRRLSIVISIALPFSTYFIDSLIFVFVSSSWGTAKAK